MFRVKLINMPFADWHRPSFALSQLAALAKREFPEHVDVDVLYLNQDFASYLGAPTYTALAQDLDHLLTGVGDWLFRKIAFPEEPDNTEEYFRRYYRGPRWQDFRQRLLEQRAGLETLCRELTERHQLASADLVGFTSMFAQTGPSVAVARLVKEASPGTVTIMGGANCETPMGTVIAKNVSAIDFVFSGPALHTFPDLLRCLLHGNLEAAHSIRGILSRRNYADPRFRSAIGAERDIDDFFEPDYESFFQALADNPDLTTTVDEHTRPVLYFETSRGCWWGERSHCTFCGLNGLSMNYRVMSPEVALRQFRWLFGFASRCQIFACTDNIMPKNFPRAVFDRLDPPPDISIFYEIKLPVSEREMRTMSAARVNKVQPGVEALATETLRLMRKGTTVFQNLQFLKSCVRYDIAPGWNLLVGFPGEREDTYRKYVQDIPLLAHLPPPTGAYMVRFDRYSPYFAAAAEYGLKLEPMDYYRLVYPFRDQDLEHIAYFFADTSIASYAVNAARWLGELNLLVDDWKRKWNEVDGGTPQLFVETDSDGNLTLCDSRSGTTQHVPLHTEAGLLIGQLSSPIQADRIGREVGLPDDVVARRLDFLDEHGALFWEGDTVMSLVVDGAPRPGGSTPQTRPRNLARTR